MSLFFYSFERRSIVYGHGPSKKIQPPTRPGNGKVKPMPSGPSPHVRKNFIEKVKEVLKKKNQTPPK